MKGGEGGELDKANTERQEITMEEGIKQMIEEKMKNYSKEAGVKSRIFFIKVQTSNQLDEWLSLSEEMNIDLVVMASGKITSSVRVLGSTLVEGNRTVQKPVLVYA